MFHLEIGCLAILSPLFERALLIYSIICSTYNTLYTYIYKYIHIYNSLYRLQLNKKLCCIFRLFFACIIHIFAMHVSPTAKNFFGLVICIPECSPAIPAPDKRRQTDIIISGTLSRQLGRWIATQKKRT